MGIGRLLFVSCGLLMGYMVSAAPLYAATYYVATTGSDTAIGTYTQPFRTLQKAAATAIAGDTVQVLAGTYSQKFAPVNSGTAAAYITYMPYPGAEVILDGTNVPLSMTGYAEGLIQIAGKSYLRIQGFTLRNSSGNGINIIPAATGTRSSHLEISGNRIENTRQNAIKATRSQWLTISNNTIKHVDYSSGIGVWFSEDVIVDGNTIDTPHWYHECQGAHEEGLTIANVNRFEVKNNTLDYTEAKPAGYCANAQRLGIDVKESSQQGSVHHNTVRNFDAGGIYIDGWHAGANNTPTLNHINIYQNTIRDGGGITVGCEQADGIVEYINVYNNVVVNAYFSGIQVRGAYGNGLRKNIGIYNNTVYGANPLGGHGGAGIYVTTANLQSNTADPPVIIRNNISHFNFPNGGAYVGQIRAGTAAMAALVAASHNLVYGPMSCSTEFPNCVEVGSRITAAPATVFVNPTGYDLHLRAASPAINAGVTVPLVLIDFDGKTRPQQTAYDIGAFEYGTTATPAPVPGDANGDNRVDGIDYMVWRSHYNQSLSGASNGDFNLDNRVDGIDYMVWRNHYTQ